MEKLGLQRFVAFGKAGEKSRPEELTSLFTLMGDYAYLEHYQRLDPSNQYLLIFSMPPELIHEVNDFLAKLGRNSILKVTGPGPIGWMRYHPLRAPWNPPPSEPVTSGPLSYIPEAQTRVRPSRFDYKELLLLAALQAYPSADRQTLDRTLRNWAEAGYDEINPHLSSLSSEWDHYIAGALKLVDSFPVHLSRGQPGVIKRKRHQWASLTTWWKQLTTEEVRRAAMASTAVPYLRTDGANAESGLYFSVMSAPTRLIPGYLNFLSRFAPKGMNVAVPSRFANYSLPFPSFQPQEGRWTWKKEKLETLLATLQKV